MKKALYPKLKLLHQTKINLWGKDEALLKKKLNKQKWGFLKFRRQKPLDYFSFNPFDSNPFRRRLNSRYKNNLYFRKLVQLKYARLKDKEFYNIFKKSKGYKKLIQNLGNRLDVNIYNILPNINSIFFIRQRILHGFVLVNGRVVSSPNIELKPLDVISLKLTDFSNDLAIFKDIRELEVYVSAIARGFYLVGLPFRLTEGGQENFIQVLSGLIRKKGQKGLKKFFTKAFNGFEVQRETDRQLQEVVKHLIKVPKTKKVTMAGLLKIFQKTYMRNQLKAFFQSDYRERVLAGIKFNSKESLKASSLNFFDKGFNYNNFEFKLNGDFLDIVFLGYDENNIVLNNNDKYSLHYLYR